MEESKKIEKEEKEQNPKSKKKKIQIWIVVGIVVVALCYGGGFFLGKKLGEQEKTKESSASTKKSETKEEKEEKEKKEDSSKEDEKERIEELTENELTKNIPEINSIISYFNSYFSEKYPIEIRTLTNQEILYSGLREVLYNSSKSGNTNTFSVESLYEQLKKWYGEDIVYQDADIECLANDGPLYEFTGSNYQRVGTHGHGGDGGYRSVKYFIKATKKDTEGTIEAEYKILYGGFCGDTCGPATNVYKEGKLKAEKLLPEETELYSESDYDNAYEKVKDKLPITKYIFKKDSVGNYGIASIKVEE